MSPAAPRLLQLQRTLAALILEPEAAAFSEDPASFAARQGLAGPDQRALQRFQDRLLAYRELARASLVEPLEDMFPVLRALLAGAGAWEPCVNGFLLARQLQSPHYRDIAPTFLGWLVETGWGQDRWPFLAELAHFELLETLVARYPEQAPAQNRQPNPQPEPQSGAGLTLAPATQLVAYSHAVQRASEQDPVPPAQPTYLLAYRDAHGDFQLMELTDAAAALLTRAQTAPILDVAASLGLQQLDRLWTLLCDLRGRGALSFQPLT